MHELHQLVFQSVRSGVRLLADMRRSVCNSSSERTGAGKMRFFACDDAAVDENVRIERWAGMPRSILVDRDRTLIVIVSRYNCSVRSEV